MEGGRPIVPCDVWTARGVRCSGCHLLAGLLSDKKVVGCLVDVEEEIRGRRSDCKPVARHNLAALLRRAPEDRREGHDRHVGVAD